MSEAVIEFEPLPDSEEAAKLLGNIHLGRDIEEMISRKLTFEEAVKSKGFTILTKQRLLVVQRDLFEQMDGICLL